MNIAEEDALVYRVERTKERSDTSQCADSLPIWGFRETLGKYDQVNPALPSSQSNRFSGYIGLYEVITVFMVR